MPNSWYNLNACGDNQFLQSICADKKPYFMIYLYDNVKIAYKNYIKISETKCKSNYKCTIQDLYDSYENLNEEQKDFLFWYERKMPVGMGNCTMNRICKYIESEIDDYKTQLHKNSDFNYEILKYNKRCTSEHFDKLLELENFYSECVHNYRKKVDTDDGVVKNQKRKSMILKFKTTAKDICPNDEERLNIILDITYRHNGNRQFFFDTVGDIFAERLEMIRE